MKKLLGRIAIDTATLVLSDPVNYDKMAENALSGKTGRFGKLKGIPLGCLGLSVMTGYGDGLYPVYATVEEGRIDELTIDFRLPSK